MNVIVTLDNLSRYEFLKYHAARYEVEDGMVHIYRGEERVATHSYGRWESVRVEDD